MFNCISCLKRTYLEETVFFFSVIGVSFLQVTTVHPSHLLLAPFFKLRGGIVTNLSCMMSQRAFWLETTPSARFQFHLKCFIFYFFFSVIAGVIVLFSGELDIFVCNQSCKVVPLESRIFSPKEVRTWHLYAALRQQQKKKKSFISCSKGTLENPHLLGKNCYFIYL